MVPIEILKSQFPEKFAAEDTIFRCIHRGDTIFIGSACAEPQYLVASLIRYVQANSKAFFDTRVLSIRSLGIAPYATEKFKQNFRHNSFFVGDSVRAAVNTGLADYTPIFLSQVTQLIDRGLVPIDLALIQTSLPDEHGYVSLGISVDIAKAAVEKAKFVIAQVNKHMPRVHGDGFIHIKDIDYIIPYDEELLEYCPREDDQITQQVGKYVARLVDDGDTIQVGYGALPNAILLNLAEKKNLGVHTELISDGIVELMRRGVINNSKKTLNRGRTIATFCMGNRETYAYIDDNPVCEFRTIDYTNNPLIIAQHKNMTAINSALQIDLTGQSTAESLGNKIYSGVGGQADFMRGAILAPGGKSILAFKSTAAQETVSRIVPFLTPGSGTTLVRGDVHYVVTEYGIAYLHGKNIRERAMALISIAHPKFRAWLIDEAKKNGLIYSNQVFIPGEEGIYPEELETYRKTKSGLEILLRPMKITDETLYREFLHNMSDLSLYRRFISKRQDMPYERIQRMIAIDYKKEMALCAVLGNEAQETIIGISRYYIDPDRQIAEAAFAVRDDYQGMGIGTELLSYLTYLAKTAGLRGFTADVLAQNEPMLHIFKKAGFKIERRIAGIYELELIFA